MLRPFWRGLIPQDPESHQWMDHTAFWAGKDAQVSSLHRPAPVRVGRSPVSLTTVECIVSEFLFCNLHEATHILRDRQERRRSIFNQRRFRMP